MIRFTTMGTVDYPLPPEIPETLYPDHPDLPALLGGAVEDNLFRRRAWLFTLALLLVALVLGVALLALSNREPAKLYLSRTTPASSNGGGPR